MALVYPQILYGWSVVAGVSDQVVFYDGGNGPFTATLNPGQYYPDTYAAQVQAAMRLANTGNQNNACKFNYSNGTVVDGAVNVPTLSFELVGTGGGAHGFELDWTTNAQTQAVANQIGFSKSANSSGATAYTSASVVGGANSSAFVWTLAEPIQMNTPITAVAAGLGVVGSQALLLQRDVGVMQVASDGGVVETVQTRNLRKFKVHFDQLLAAEQTNFENWMNWAMVGQPFSWQPDKTSTGVGHFILDLTRPQIANTFQWLTRAEATYGELTFIEQV